MTSYRRGVQRLTLRSFVRSLSLLYPQAEIYRVGNRIVQKTNHNLKDIVGYYEGAFAKHGFSQTARLEQTGGALLQYERTTKIERNDLGGYGEVAVCG